MFKRFFYRSIHLFSQLGTLFFSRRGNLPFSLSPLTLSVGLLIVISASFMRQVVDSLRNSILGGKGVEVFIVSLLAGIGVLFVIRVLRKKTSFIRKFLIFTIIAAGFLGMMQLELAVEKIHILEYAFLGWLALGDTTRKYPKTKGFLIAVIFCAVTGYIDELFQGVLPYRFYDNRDIVLNVLGALEGIALYFFYKR